MSERMPAMGDVTAHAVVVRRRHIAACYPWPHYIGALPTEEGKSTPDEVADHPFRTGELMRTIPLSADMTLLEIGTVVATLCEYNDVLPARCAMLPLARMLRHVHRDPDDPGKWIVAGGIEVCVNGEPVVGPQCCCGLETWREWQRFAGGGNPPWCGHGPDPLLCRLESGELQLGYQDEPAPATMAPETLRAALEGVERDLQGFLGALADWAEQVVPRLAPAFVATFAETMDIRRAAR